MKYNTKLSPGFIRVVPAFKNEWQFAFPRLDERAYEMFDEAVEEFQVGNLKKAATDFRLLIEGFPEFLDAYHHLAMVSSQTGMQGQAHELWRLAAEIGKNAFPKSFKRSRHRLPWGILENRQFLRPYHAWGLELFRNDEIVEALDVFKEILSMNPNDNQGIRALVIDCYFRLKQPERVLTLCRRFSNDTMEEVLYGRALALFQIGKKDDSKVALQEAIKWLPNIASELIKKTHRPPPDLNSKFVTGGGSDQAFYYWQSQGQYWKNTEGALEFLSSVLGTKKITHAHHSTKIA